MKMKKKKSLMLLMAGLMFAACQMGDDGGIPGADPGANPAVVSAFSLDGLVTAPVRGAAHTGAFAASTVYRAVLTLAAKSGYTFTGVVSDTFTYTGAAVTNAANSGTVTIVFPATGASGASGALTGISIGFTGPTGNGIILDGGFWLSKSDSAYSSLTISVKNTGDYDTFRWLVDGDPLGLLFEVLAGKYVNLGLSACVGDHIQSVASDTASGERRGA
jgi:hypothetical protein